MAQIKVLKFLNGLPTEMNTSLDSIVANSFVVGGPSGTALTQTILNTLTAGPSSDASTLHAHDGRYFTQSQTINSSTGAANAGAPIKTDSRGKIDPSFYQQSDISHSNLSNLSSDDHPQYFNQTRGDARYVLLSALISVTTGAANAGAPVKTNSSGVLDGSLLVNAGAATQHNSLLGLQGGQSSQYYHLTQTEHDTLTGAGGVVDASTLHNHSSLYYTQTQVTNYLANKADLSIVIKKDGSIAFTAAQSMGGNKLTNLANGTASTDAVAYGQLTSALASYLGLAGGTMSGAINMGGFQINNIGNAVNGTDAVNLNQLQNYLSGVQWRPEVDLLDTVDTTLPTTTATQIDGVTVVNGYRVLFTNLSSGNNEVYTAAVSGSAITWTAAMDLGRTSAAAVKGDSVVVEFGTNYAEAAYNFNGTSFVQFNGAGQIQAGAGLSKSGNSLSVATGAGITFLPAGDVGINLYSSSGLKLVDPTSGSASTASNAQLAIKLADSTLSVGASGLQVGVIQTANIAANAITSSLIASGAVGSSQIASGAVGTSQIATGAITSSLIASGAVGPSQLASGVAGNGLLYTSGVLSVKTDGTTVDLNGSNQIEVKAGGIGTTQLAASAVDSTKISFGTTGNGVNASSIPILNANSLFQSSTTVEAALNELADSNYVTKDYSSGEAIGQYDLVCLRRNLSNALQIFKASAASADNLIQASLVLGDLTYTAVSAYNSNQISLTYINPSAANAVLNVSVTGSAISVSLATNSSAALNSTASQIATAIAANPSAAALVTAAITGSGSAIETAYAQTYLSGGSDYNDNGRWEVYGMALDAATGSGTAIRIKKFGPLSSNFVSAPTAGQIGQSVYLSTNKGKAVVNYTSGSTGDAIVLLGRMISTTQFEFRAPILRGVNG